MADSIRPGVQMDLIQPSNKMNPPNKTEPGVLTAVRVRFPTLHEDIFTNVISGASMMQMGNMVFPYAADHLLPCGHTQESVFEDVAKPFVQKFISGQENVTMIAFGPKRSGKTFTLFGPDSQVFESAIYYGVYQRLAFHLYSQFESFMVSGPEPQVKVYVGFFEQEKSYIKDLLTNNIVPTEVEASVLAAGLSRELLSTLTYEMCSSARNMVQWLNVALHNRQTRPAHVFAHVLLHQPVLAEGGQYIHTETSALLVEVGNCLTEYPQMTNCDEQYVLQYLATTLGERLTVPQLRRPEGFLLQLLKQSFNGERTTLAMCCVSPGSADTAQATEYLTTLAKITNMRLNKYFQRTIIKTSDADSLLSEAESLMKKFYQSRSISEEDRRQFSRWLAMKKELTMKKESEESANAQGHGQQECSGKLFSQCVLFN